MITIKKLTWSNWFSYGENNIIDLEDSKVIQITGKNGSGKSSIPVIIGEVLYSKNAFGKVKQKLFNRYLEKPALKATIEFEKDGHLYKVDYNRKTTLKIVLFEDGIDISSHSSTNTLKTLDDILGFDFKLFWQLVYQSSTIGLEFLTATDTNRKKFLINLFNLDKYLTIHEQFKKINAELSNELLTLKGKLSTTQSWIDRHETEDLTPKELLALPRVEKEDIDKLTELKVKLLNINETNKKINDNNQYKTLLKNLDTSILSENIEVSSTKSELENIRAELWNDISSVSTRISILNSQNNKFKELKDKCPTCEQHINEAFVIKSIGHNDSEILLLNARVDAYRKSITDIDIKLLYISNQTRKLANQQQVSNELQELLSKIDNDLPEDIIDEISLKQEIEELTNLIKSINDSISIITKANMQAEAHNSRINVIKDQLKEYKEQLEKLTSTVNDNNFIVDKIGLIKKAFSTNGLLNYKIENLVKDLEHQINTYLEELSNGRFQLVFALNGEKLDIDIIDDGKTIGIEELSAGELARINTSTLLAIRKLMAAISSTKLNILFLDEIMGVLDDEGKEKLIDILNSETELNTFLVSHEFSHPLIPKINIIKEDKISRVEYG